MFLGNIRLRPFTGEFWIAKSCWGFVILAFYWLAVRCLQAEHRCRIKVSRYEALPCFVDSRVICFGWREDGLTGCKLNGQPGLPLIWNTQLYCVHLKALFLSLLSNGGRIAIYCLTPDTSAWEVPHWFSVLFLWGGFNSVPWRCETSPGQQEAHD